MHTWSEVYSRLVIPVHSTEQLSIADRSGLSAQATPACSEQVAFNMIIFLQ